MNNYNMITELFTYLIAAIILGALYLLFREIYLLREDIAQLRNKLQNDFNSMFERVQKCNHDSIQQVRRILTLQNQPILSSENHFTDLDSTTSQDDNDDNIRQTPYIMLGAKSPTFAHTDNKYSLHSCSNDQTCVEQLNNSDVHNIVDMLELHSQSQSQSIHDDTQQTPIIITSSSESEHADVVISEHHAQTSESTEHNDSTSQHSSPAPSHASSHASAHASSRASERASERVSSHASSHVSSHASVRVQSRELSNASRNVQHNDNNNDESASESSDSRASPFDSVKFDSVQQAEMDLITIGTKSNKRAGTMPIIELSKKTDTLVSNNMGDISKYTLDGLRNLAKSNGIPISRRDQNNKYKVCTKQELYDELRQRLNA